jgi:hypothetical protein
VKPGRPQLASPDVGERFVRSAGVLPLRKSADRAPQRMQARRTEAKIMEMMPPRIWLSCTAVARLIAAADDRKTRARLDRLVSDCKIERKRERGTHGPVHLFRRA